ncbi:MAG: hypothetical protein L3J75_15380 [Methylococcaceae bacterium]|nr:hypothetical protein [Methylococcaceae bacterium]
MFFKKIFLLLLFIISIGNVVYAGGVGEGCSAFYPCDDKLSCQPFVQKCYNSPRKENQPCSLGYYCESGLTCEAGSQVCRAPGRAGDACHLTRPCGSGLNCQPGVHKCYNVPRLENQPCSAGYSCGTDLTCEAGSQVCRAKGKLGDACHATRPCGTGLSCQPGVHKCFNSPRLENQPCSAGFSCSKGLRCAAGKQICEKPELKQCIKNMGGYSIKVEWYDPTDLVLAPDTMSLTAKEGASPAQVNNHITLFRSSCNDADKYRTAIVRVIGGDKANTIITIAAGTTVGIVGAAVGAAVCIGSAGTGCPVVASLAVAIGTTIAEGGALTGGLFLPDAKEIVYIGMPEKNVEVQLGGTIWEPTYSAGNLRGGPRAHDGSSDQACVELVQGKVAWNKAGNKKWNEVNMRKLCKNTMMPTARINCFNDGISKHGQWARAIKECAPE